MSRHRTIKYALLLPAVAWVLVFTVYPVLAALRFSFARYVLGRGIVAWVGLANFRDVLVNPEFWHSVLITLIYVGVSVTVETLLGFTFAWFITLGPPGFRFFRALITAPLFTMGVAVGYLGVTMFSDQGGIITYLLGALGIHIPWMSTAYGGLAAAILLDIWRWTPFMFLIIVAGMSAIPDEVYEVSLLDTSSQWNIVRYITLPLVWPVTTIAILLRLVEGFKTFGLPYALTSGGPGTSTQLFSTMDYLTTIQFFDFGHGSAMGFIFLILVSVVLVIFFRQMRRSIE